MENNTTKSAALSPCVGICALDQQTGWCMGCGRSGDEIAAWNTMSPAEQNACWDKLEHRLGQLSVRVRLLPWSAEEVAVWVSGTLTNEHGTWVTGVPGAVAEFPCGPSYVEECERRSSVIIGRAKNASFRLKLHDKLRAFSFGDGQPIVLGLPKARSTLPVAETVTSLGADHAAVDDRFSSQTLFDFGLGRTSSRFCIRTGEPELLCALETQCGKAWSSVMSAIGSLLLAYGPHRVVESALARIEVYTPIPAPGTTTPPGAHTHFLPQFLKSGEDAPAGLTLPDFALPVAIYYPKTS
ncbi:MAG: DUF1289 domain-containing protein [Hyphomicrobiaceae bacterium]|nr:DUF1289 domain-containing protein [Hyphomicrobiaceae bacterium]